MLYIQSWTEQSIIAVFPVRVGQVGGAKKRNGGTEYWAGKGGRKIATHNAPPGGRCCCWRRKAVRPGAVSLVTGGGEIMK